MLHDESPNIFQRSRSLHNNFIGGNESLKYTSDAEYPPKATL